jgi:hypothetical protein
MSRTSDTLPWGQPQGEIRVETPDGVNFTRGSKVHNNLYDTFDEPMIQSGDQQTRSVRYRPHPGRITE